MDDFWFGTLFVSLSTIVMKRFSNKDLVIVFGVLVAAVIVIISIYLKDSVDQSEVKAPLKKIKPAAILKAAVQKLTSSTSI